MGHFIVLLGTFDVNYGEVTPVQICMKDRNDDKYGDDHDDNDITPCYDWYNRGRSLTCAAPDLYDKLERPQALLTVCRDICNVPWFSVCKDVHYAKTDSML